MRFIVGNFWKRSLRTDRVGVEGGFQLFGGCSEVYLQSKELGVEKEGEGFGR